MNESKAGGFPVAHIKDLLRADEDVNVGSDAVNSCLDHLENLKEKFNQKLTSRMKSIKRKTIRRSDVDTTLTSIGIDTDKEFPNPRLTKAASKRFFEAKNLELWVSGGALFMLKNSLEAYIREIGGISRIYIAELNRKTINSQAVLKAIESISPTISLSYIEFMNKIWSKNELKEIGALYSLELSGTKEKMVEFLYNLGISLNDIIDRMEGKIGFGELKKRMIRNDFPVPLSFPNILTWVEQPIIQIMDVDTLHKEVLQDDQTNESILDMIEENIEKSNRDKIEELESEDLNRVLEEKFDYGEILTEANQLKLHEIISNFIPLSTLRKIDEDLDLDLDFTNEKKKLADDFTKTGISITYFLREVPNKHLKEFLRVLNLPVGGNNKSLIERILSAIEFADYDISHDDVIFAIQGDDFMKQREEEKKTEELLFTKIRDYSGSLKLEILLLIESFSFIVTEKILVEKYTEGGREPLSFYGPIGSLLRDGIITVDVLKEEKEYYVPKHILESLKSALLEVKKDIEKWKGAVDDLPNSSKFLLSLVCSYGEAVNLLEIREKFKEIYRTSKTWSSARERLRERALIVERYDEGNDEQVIHAPRLICPILSGILKTYKEKILSDKQEELKRQKETLELDITKYTAGEKELLYILINSGGQVEKTSLRNIFTTPPGTCYTYKTLLRYLFKLKKEEIGDETLISEEIDSETNETIVKLNYGNAESLKRSIEESLFNINLEKEFDNFSDSAKTMIKIILDEGGSILVKNLRKIYLEYYPGPTFYKTFSLLDELLLAEGMNSSGDSLMLIPDVFLADIDAFFLKNPIDIRSREYEKVEVEDFILNLYSSKSLRRISDDFEIFSDIEDLTILKKLIHEYGFPLIQLMVEIIPKNELVIICIDNQISHTGSKQKLVTRILDSDLIKRDENINLEGELRAAIERLKSKLGVKVEKDEELILAQGWAELLDATTLFESIAPEISKEEMNQKAKELDLTYSGTKLQKLREIFVSSELSYDLLIEMFLNDNSLSNLRLALNNNEITKQDVSELLIRGIPGLPDKNKKYEINEFLELLLKSDLQEVSLDFGLKKSGTKQELINNLHDNFNEKTKAFLQAILRKNSGWVTSINKKYSLDIRGINIVGQLIKILGYEERDEKIEEGEVQDSQVSDRTYSKDLLGLRQLITDTVIEEEVEEALYTSNVDDFDNLAIINVFPFLQELSAITIRKLVKEVDMPIDLNRDRKMLKEKLMSWFNVPVPSKSDRSKAEDLRSLGLRNLPALAFGVSSFSRGWITEGFKRSFRGNLYKRLLDKLSEETKNDNNVKGYMFEVSLAKCLEKLKSKELEIGILYAKPYVDYDNYTLKPSESDGRIVFKRTKREKEINLLYDCKAYPDGFQAVINKNFKVYTGYIREESQASNIDFKGIIIFAPKFTYSKQKLEEKMNSDPFLTDKTVILFHANALAALYNAEYNQPGILKLFPWYQFMNFSNRFIEVEKNDIDKAINSARRSMEKYST